MKSNLKIILCSTAVLSLMNMSQVNASHIIAESMAAKASSQRIAEVAGDLTDIEAVAASRAHTIEQMEQEETVVPAVSSMNTSALFFKACFALALLALVA